MKLQRILHKFIKESPILFFTFLFDSPWKFFLLLSIFFYIFIVTVGVYCEQISFTYFFIVFWLHISLKFIVSLLFWILIHMFIFWYTHLLTWCATYYVRNACKKNISMRFHWKKKKNYVERKLFQHFRSFCFPLTDWDKIMWYLKWYEKYLHHNTRKWLCFTVNWKHSFTNERVKKENKVHTGIFHVSIRIDCLCDIIKTIVKHKRYYIQFCSLAPISFQHRWWRAHWSSQMNRKRRNIYAYSVTILSNILRQYCYHFLAI